MFNFVFFFGYLFPCLYIFFRLRQHFIPQRFRTLFFWIYLVIALINPIHTLIADGDSDFNVGILTWITRYIFPYYFYLFLLLVVYDLILLLNAMVRMVSKERRKSFAYRIMAFAVLLLIPSLIVSYGAYNFNHLQVTKYDLEIPRKSSPLDHLRIAFIADFHLKRSSEIEKVERFVEQVNEIHPDLVIMGGDIVEGSVETPFLLQVEHIFRQIKARYGVYATLGNHEFNRGPASWPFFGNAGITLLRDSVVEDLHGFVLAGRYDDLYRKRVPAFELLKHVPDTLPILLVDHRPTDIEAVSKTKTDLQLSGHTHNGQLFPFNLLLKLLYRLSYGHEKIENTHFIVTSGIRLWGSPVRTTGKTEIVQVDLTLK